MATVENSSCRGVWGAATQRILGLAMLDRSEAVGITRFFAPRLGFAFFGLRIEPKTNGGKAPRSKKAKRRASQHLGTICIQPPSKICSSQNIGWSLTTVPFIDETWIMPRPWVGGSLEKRGNR